MARAVLAVASLTPVSAAAGALLPVKPVARQAYSGRWYEIARTPNLMQKDCQGATSDFLPRPDGTFLVTETCRRGSAKGVAKLVKARATISAPDNTRFRLSFLGGLVRQEYWILDHADDNAWMLMGTPGGNYVWLLSRRPVLPSSILAAAIGRASALGYPSRRLIYPAQKGS